MGISEINSSGNLIFHSYIKSQRIQFASNNKRIHDIRIGLFCRIAKSTTDLARIILERLNLGNKKSYSKKFNRMRHNFVYRKVIEAIQVRAIKFGIQVIGVNPAFTSIPDILKYQNVFINRHTAAALIITRRGLGIKERQDFMVLQAIKTDGFKSKSGISYTLEGRGKSTTLSDKVWSWMMDQFLRPKLATLTGSGPASGSKPGIGSNNGKIPLGESRRITGNPGQFDLNCGVGSDS